MRLDLGGTAKGWSADIAARLLGRLGPSVVDIGGDIAIGGRAREPWPIAVANPNGSEPVDVVMLMRGGIATSGRDFRRWRRGAVEQHHIIDPRTGAPAKTDVWTATVIATSALDADVTAKRVFLDGSAAGLSWIESRPDLAAIVVCDDGRVLRSARLHRYAWRPAA
jgi:thiamine biosynthesis lipoprotein